MIFNLTGGGIAGAGTGAGLNFRVVGGTTEPSNPVENTIWVNTSTEITSWILSPTEPSTSIGKVWIKIGDSAPTGFNALKKNGIQVYTIAAYQWDGSAWVSKIAKTYQNGASESWVRYIYETGFGLRDAITGFNVSGNSNSSGSDVTVDETQITAKLKVKESTTKFQSNEAIDVTDYKTLIFTGVTASWSPSNSATHTMKFFVTGAGDAEVTIGNGNGDKYPNRLMCSDASFTIDVSSISGNVNIGGLYSSSRMDETNTGTIIIKNIYLE